MNVFAGAALALIAMLLIQTVRPTRPEFAVLVRIAAGAMLAGAALTATWPIWTELEQMLTRGAPSEWILPLIKSAGICLIAQFAAECCRDAGESALAGRVEFIGKTAMLTVAMPLFREILRTVDGLLS